MGTTYSNEYDGLRYRSTTNRQRKSRVYYSYQDGWPRARDPEWKTKPTATHTMARPLNYDEQDTYPAVIRRTGNEENDLEQLKRFSRRGGPSLGDLTLG